MAGSWNLAEWMEEAERLARERDEARASYERTNARCIELLEQSMTLRERAERAEALVDEVQETNRNNVAMADFRISALEQDAARLDWLEEADDPAFLWRWGMVYIESCPDLAVPDGTVGHRTVREAIDAALARAAEGANEGKR